MPEATFALDRDRIEPPGGAWRASVFRETESTNDIALRAAEGGEAEGFAVFAETQTRGRGQFGRRWHSSAGLGIWFSILLRPRWPVARLAQMTPLIAVAAVRALASRTGLPIRLKAPNDLHCAGRKVAGILSEARTGRDLFVVVGMGINVNHARVDFPIELQASATSLALETGVEWDRNFLARAVLDEIGRAYDPLAEPGKAILDEYAALSRGANCDSVRP